MTAPRASEHRTSSPSRLPAVFLLLSLGAYGGMLSMQVRLGKLGEQVTPEFLAWYGLAFAVYLAALVWSEKAKQIDWRWLWGGAILFRLLLLFTTPTLSTDVYRYLWDGHVAVHGVSPYAHPIDAAELDALDAPVRALANHTWMASPYMPGAQLLFALLAWIFPLTPRVHQVAMVLFDLGAALLLARLLALARLPARRLLLYLWNPLVVVEVAHGAHVDAWMAFLMAAAAWTTLGLTERGSLSNGSENRSDVHGPGRSLFRALLSPLLLALATLTKLIPVVLTPVYFWQWRWRERLIYAGTVAGALLAAGVWTGNWGVWGPLDGRGLFGALRIYADRWNFNSGLFHWLEAGLVGAGVADFNGWAKRIVLLLLVGVLFCVWVYAQHRTSQPRTFLRLLAVPMAAYVLLTTTFHPWYLLALMPWIPFLAPGDDETAAGWLWVIPWLWLSWALALSYLTYIDPQNLREYEWIRRTEWLPALALLAGAAGSWWWHAGSRNP